MYLLFSENSNQTWVSAASPSESDNFDIKDFGYLLFLKASAIFTATDLELLLI